MSEMTVLWGGGDGLREDNLKETKQKRELSEIACCYDKEKIISNT
jgi:hypothetical protein